MYKLVTVMTDNNNLELQSGSSWPNSKPYTSIRNKIIDIFNIEDNEGNKGNKYISPTKSEDDNVVIIKPTRSEEVTIPIKKKEICSA